MKKLHAASAVIELGAGLALLAFPSVVVKLLLGSPLDTAATVALGRLAGAALFTLGMACWRARCAAQNRAASGLVVEMLFYNLAAVTVLASFGLGTTSVGIALWPAVGLHSLMAIWCVRAWVQSGKNVSP
jgi:hypothetical protein